VGDAVNTAARMCSHGAPGRVHVSAATYEHLAPHYLATPHGPLQIKGKGLMTCYFLERRLSPSEKAEAFPSTAAAAPTCAVPPVAAGAAASIAAPIVQRSAAKPPVAANQLSGYIPHSLSAIGSVSGSVGSSGGSSSRQCHGEGMLSPQSELGECAYPLIRRSSSDGEALLLKRCSEVGDGEEASLEQRTPSPQHSSDKRPPSPQFSDKQESSNSSVKDSVKDYVKDSVKDASFKSNDGTLNGLALAEEDPTNSFSPSLALRRDTTQPELKRVPSRSIG